MGGPRAAWHGFLLARCARCKNACQAARPRPARSRSLPQPPRPNPPPSPPEEELLERLAPPEAAGRRLDQVAAELFAPRLSRAQVQRLLGEGRLSLDGREAKASARLQGGEALSLRLPPPQPLELRPEAMDLAVLLEDPHLIVVNKAPGVVVHPAAGHETGTLVHGLLHHCGDLAGVGGVLRPGIVHRLDMDTSGALVAAKDDRAHRGLVAAFAAGRVKKEYLALVWGRVPEDQGEITAEIGRHPTQRHKMAVTARRGRQAATSWQRLQEYPGPLTLLEIRLHTGRTHQIRVHMTSWGHPVVGDKVYGGGEKRLLSLSSDIRPLGSLVDRQLLHAWKLRLCHPRGHEELNLTAPIPEDFQAVLDFLAGTHD